MEGGSNAFYFMSQYANRYWKSKQMADIFPVCLSKCGAEWLLNQNLAESVMCCSAIHSCSIFFGWMLGVQLSAKSPSNSDNCVKTQQHISAISTNGIFPQTPILSTSGAERKRWEHYQMCLSSFRQHDPGGWYRYRVTFSVWFSDINAISCLITMGTFPRVLDLINDFFLGFHLFFPSIVPALLHSFSVLLSR